MTDQAASLSTVRRAELCRNQFSRLAIGGKEDSVTVACLKPLLASGLVQPAQPVPAP